MIAVDTNILVYAHRTDSDWHAMALRELTTLSKGQVRWAIPWPCIHEFLAIVTHPRIYQPPTPPTTAIDCVRVWLKAPSCTAIGEGPGYLNHLSAFVEQGQVVGGMVHDARIAAICLYHGVSVLWTADRDFSRYPRLKAKNPLV